MDNETASAVVPDVMQPSTDIAILGNRTLYTTLPDEIIIKVNSELPETLKIDMKAAQDVVNRYNSVCAGVMPIINKIRSIAVTDVSQKDEMDEAHRNRMLLVKIRGELDTVRTEEKTDAKNRIDFVDGMARGIRDFLKDVETYAQFQEDFKKRELAKKRDELHLARLQMLQPYLAADDGEPHGLADMKEDAFAVVLETAKRAHTDRLAVERWKELTQFGYDGPVTETLGAMTDEYYGSLLAQTIAAHDEMQARKQRAAERRESRIKQLSQIGMRYQAVSNSFAYDEMMVTDLELNGFDDVAFSKVVSDYGATITARETVKANAASQQRATEERKIARVNRLSALGMVYDGSQYRYDDLVFSDLILQGEDDDAFNAEFDRLTPEVNHRIKIKADAAWEAKEFAAQEAERQAAAARLRLAPDKEKMDRWLRDIQALPKPDLTTDEARDIQNRFFVELSELVNRYANEVSGLAAAADCPF